MAPSTGTPEYVPMMPRIPKIKMSPNFSRRSVQETTSRRNGRHPVKTKATVATTHMRMAICPRDRVTAKSPPLEEYGEYHPFSCQHYRPEPVVRRASRRRLKSSGGSAVRSTGSPVLGWTKRSRQAWRA